MKEETGRASWKQKTVQIRRKRTFSGLGDKQKSYLFCSEKGEGEDKSLNRSNLL
jgi:hypothetical protein